ncbi:MAG: DUF1490 domain-containing protein [Coriobacteriaceae bacterium]|uniref:DUF1490 domain-containing protein n=1 Tax=Tractidigestivibacter sp. TaxID=2847320 RepID=UPI002A7F125F|nr:DUF1490 domain-containing protein [Tractidigestivibacter sp.]MCI6273457.1 DUF1490 domain-containing protein [Coriobacteriaceae bacterium]MCI6547376.1 DUF1490 domain-containing protein [Coriobacteriaceae bacterium]MCI7438865.1 DUF1490 domain-containing protein [Coriobacteriaceae bacterium]MDD7585209.1 DUF1490 domain-containing protein [Coriobacteriaceae bacterium]MDY4535647.1 DUF1490 domain-containing protein [Tractidigestivibacter sp.]
MSAHHFWLFAGGAAAAGAVAGLASSGLLHKAAVDVTTGCMRVGDAVSSEAQSIADDAADARADARRQAKIDAAVAERLQDLEPGIREEVTRQVDGEGTEA